MTGQNSSQTRHKNYLGSQLVFFCVTPSFFQDSLLNRSLLFHWSKGQFLSESIKSTLLYCSQAGKKVVFGLKTSEEKAKKERESLTHCNRQTEGQTQPSSIHTTADNLQGEERLNALKRKEGRENNIREDGSYSVSNCGRLRQQGSRKMWRPA